MSQESDQDVNEEILNLKDEIKNLQDTLKKFMVDVRTTLDESLQNPFNILRTVMDESDIEKIKEVAKSRASATPVKRKTIEEVEKAEKVEKIGSKADLDTVVRVLRWVISMIDLGVPADKISGVASAAEYAGIIPNGSTEIVRNVADTLKKARMKGMAEEIILSLYQLSGETSMDMKQLISMILRKRGDEVSRRGGE